MLASLRERDAPRRELELRERDALLGRMAASIAHDIRNPLNYLSLAIDHMLADESASNVATLGAKMKTEIRRANDRIAEFLRLGKATEPHPEDVAIGTLLDSVAQAAAHPDYSIEVVAEGAGRAFVDPTVVAGILRNLLTNAFQASAPGSSGTLRAVAMPTDRVAISVEDQGPGFDPAVLEHLFEPYFTTKSGGVGIGLVIARRAARDHGGDLVADNREGGGARLTLTLPRRMSVKRS